MELKSFFRKLVLVILFMGVAVPFLSARRTSSDTAVNNRASIIGDWFAEIILTEGVPGDETTILMEMNFLDKKNCIIKCRWSGGCYPTEEDSGKARYKLEGNRLIITFLNKKELIRTDHIFDLRNVYDITLTKDSLVILKNRQFRDVDVNFGRGYENRGYTKVVFPEDE